MQLESCPELQGLAALYEHHILYFIYYIKKIYIYILYTYSVRSPLALVHIDMNHKLIRYGLGSVFMTFKLN